MFQRRACRGQSPFRSSEKKTSPSNRDLRNNSDHLQGWCNCLVFHIPERKAFHLSLEAQHLQLAAFQMSTLSIPGESRMRLKTKKKCKAMTRVLF